MIPKPLNNKDNYVNAQNILYIIKVLKEHNLVLEHRDGEFYTVLGFSDAYTPSCGMKDVDMHMEAIRGYNNAVNALCCTDDRKFIDTVYVMVSMAQPAGLLRKRTFNESLRVGNVDNWSTAEHMADCEVQLDLLANLLKAASLNPLSEDGATKRYAKKAHSALGRMRDMYEYAERHNSNIRILRSVTKDVLEYNMVVINKPYGDDGKESKTRRRDN